jgi:hypothetical protein
LGERERKERGGGGERERKKEGGRFKDNKNYREER